MIQFNETIRGNTVHATFKSPDPDELVKAVYRYENDYPYAGYMTRVVEEGQESDGSFYKIVYRMASCD